MNSFSSARSSATLRGNMLVAWFADATPPVLWRWTPEAASTGFALRQENGRTELVKHEAAGGTTVVAVFSNEQSAARALERLSHVLLKQKFTPYGDGAMAFPSSAASTILKRMGGLFAFILVLVALAWIAIRLFMGAMSHEVSDSPELPGLNAARATGAISNQAAAPPQRPAAAAPAPGTPVDADSMIH